VPQAGGREPDRVFLPASKAASEGSAASLPHEAGSSPTRVLFVRDRLARASKCPLPSAHEAGSDPPMRLLDRLRDLRAVSAESAGDSEPPKSRSGSETATTRPASHETPSQPAPAPQGLETLDQPLR